ncbi:MAG: hypothetical protein MJ169_02620 [Treponema sp.]|nr:hypothetical protein [Treponema sp.]
MSANKAYFHLPGLFEFYELYEKFLPLFFDHKEYFYDWCDIGSIYGAPGDCLWGGGRTGFGRSDINLKVLELVNKYNISARLTFSNSLLQKEHLSDSQCNKLCSMFFDAGLNGLHGVIVHSELLLDYLKENYPDAYFVSSTTKVITKTDLLLEEAFRKDFKFVVPDFRFNRDFDFLEKIPCDIRSKFEFLCNECCWFECPVRKECYRNVSAKVLGMDVPDHKCLSPESEKGYVFSRAMQSKAFISACDIRDIYLPKGFENFKIEGRSLGSALVLEFLLYYMVKPEFQLNVREAIYLDNSLDLF